MDSQDSITLDPSLWVILLYFDMLVISTHDVERNILTDWVPFVINVFKEYELSEVLQFTYTPYPF